MNGGVALIDIDKVTKLISSTDVHLKWLIDGFSMVYSPDTLYISLRTPLLFN